MVTEPPEEVGFEPAVAVAEDVGTTGSLADDDDEEEEEEGNEVLGRTGEMVTLVSFLLLVLLPGEDEPKSRPSSSSTLSKADSFFEASFVVVSSGGFTREGLLLLLSWLLLLLTVRLLRSIKSFGLSRTRLDSLGLDGIRAFLALGCSSLAGCDSLLTASPMVLLSLDGEDRLISINLTLQVLVWLSLSTHS